MTVELFYFAGCPSVDTALANLKVALSLERISVSPQTIEVSSPADVEAHRFIGSPTIRVDGVDIEGPAAEARGYGFGCRVYTDGGSTRGWPSVEQIQRALRRSTPAP